MTDRHADPKFDFYKTPERLGRKWVSCTKVDTVLNCPFAYHARYERDDLVAPPPSKAVVMGRVFDDMCEKGGGDSTLGSGTELLSNAEALRVFDRFQNYSDHIPRQATTQVPIEIDLDYKGYWVQGFIDILPDDPAEAIREVKFSQRPWSKWKFKKKKFQAVVYGVAMDYRPVQFDVSNYETDELQTFLVTPSKHMWTPARKRFIKAIDIIEGEELSRSERSLVQGIDRAPTPNHLCKGERLDDDGNVLYDWQCDYYGVCPEQIKQKELNEIVEHL